jgi:hypothetical protein
VRWQKKPGPAAVGIGSEVNGYLRARRKELENNASILDMWVQAVPVELLSRSRPDTFKSGVLRVEVQPGPWMHEFKLLIPELLTYFQEHCPRNRIRKIVCIPWREKQQEKEHERSDV